MSLSVGRAGSGDIWLFARRNADQILGKFADERSIPKQLLVDDLAKSIDEFEGLRLEYWDQGRLNAIVCVRKSDWDSQHFGVNIGKISTAIFEPDMEFEPRLRLFREAKERARAIGLQIVFGRLPLSSPRSIHAFEAVGGRLMDVLLTMRRGTAGNLATDLQWTTRTATADDMPVVKSMARQIFTIDHFHADESLDYKRSAELYSEWISNRFAEGTSTILIAAQDTKPLGFLIFKLRPVVSQHLVGIIDLVGTHPSSRRKGVGRALVSEAVRSLSPHAHSIYVGTQAANHAAISLYEECGFRSIFSEATLHLST
jgi:ribosomal protein S18 acetylase RimI-like enzyme